MRIQTNTSALKARNNFTKITGEVSKTLEQLSSGYCINKAADNAAGLAVSEKMRYMLTGLEQGELNIQDGSSYVQVAEGALFEIEDMLNRSKELTTQAMNGVYTDDERKAINDEIEQIKDEIDRIITSASFNGLSIWGDDNCSKKVIGSVEKTALTFGTNKISVNINNTNKQYFPTSGFDVDANDDGYLISWTGADGNLYKTERTAWPSPIEGSHTMSIGSNCNPVLNDFDVKIPFEVAEGATVEHLKQSLNGKNFYCNINTDKSADYKLNGIAEPAGTLNVWCDTTLNYSYLYDEKVDMENLDDGFIEPVNDVNGSNVSLPTSNSETWKISLKVRKYDANGNEYYENITAESESITYFRLNDDPTWRYTGGGYIRRTINGGTLGDALSVLDSTKVNPSIGGLDSGRIQVNFKLSDGSNTLGTLRLTYGTLSTDTASTVTTMVTSTKKVTEIDVPNKINLTCGINLVSNNIRVDSPIYEANYDVIVQGGLEETEQIHITYDQLSLDFIGMSEASVLTQEKATKTLDAITEALSIVTRQHGEFGSYTNRLEHASNSNLNRFENFQASESRIRDTDMAKVFSKYTAQNILMQAAQTLLAQANTRPEMVLQMLG